MTMIRWQCYACQVKDKDQVSLLAKLRVDETIPMINIERAYKSVKPPETTGRYTVYPPFYILFSLLIYLYHKLMHGMISIASNLPQNSKYS